MLSHPQNFNYGVDLQQSLLFKAIKNLIYFHDLLTWLLSTRTTGFQRTSLKIYTTGPGTTTLEQCFFVTIQWIRTKLFQVDLDRKVCPRLCIVRLHASG